MLWCLYHIPEFRYLRKKGRRGKKRIRPLSFSIKQAFSFDYIQATTSFWSLSTSCRGSFSLQAASMDFLMFFIYFPDNSMIKPRYNHYPTFGCIFKTKVHANKLWRYASFHICKMVDLIFNLSALFLIFLNEFFWYCIKKINLKHIVIQYIKQTPSHRNNTYQKLL